MAQELIDKIRAAAQAKGIDPEVALRIARAESGLKVNATPGTSSAGGLFQVVDKTWKEFGGAPGKKFDPDENIRVGTDIIAKNAQTLKTFLQRDPRPAEVYAAHYFGPSGAKTFLSAEPGTPMESLFPANVIKANPNLKGKTSDQVMASLETKMGGKPAAPAQAPVVSRETQTPAEKVMEPALKSGMTAQAPAPAPDKLAALGPSYQAALALSFLADTDEKEDRDIDREPGVAEKWLAESATAPRPTALAGFDDIKIKSPFAAPAQPQMLADGGEVEDMQGEARKGEAYQALEKYLQSRDEMPSVKVTTNLPEGTDGMFSSDNLNIGSGTIKINKNTPKAAVSSLLTHEMTHAADRQMKQQAMEQSMFGKGNQYTEAYEKLVGPEGRNRAALARLLRPEWEKDNRYYRADPKELAAHGVGAFAGPTLQDRGPRHIDATAATELRILMDLAQRNVDKGPTGLSKIPAFFRKMGRYEDGGEVNSSLTPQQIERIAAQEAMEREEASRPATVNPMIQRKGEAAKRLAAMRDVNPLPDPKTYAAVSGFLGTAPDEQGFSVMHPDREGIRQAGEAGFAAGTVAQIAPMGAALRGIGGKGTTAAAKMMEGMKDVPVGMSIKPVQSIYSPIPSADAPFVGRLDEFVSGLPGPVQKDQFLGMLKGKMRDYDIARAETTLADLPGNAKLNPVDLLNRIKTQYDPSQFKTTIIPPGKPGDFYQSMDNPYVGSAKDGQPLGVIHLSQGMLPDAVAQQERIKEAGLALSRIGTSGPVTAADPTIADDLLNFLQSPGVPLSDATAAKMAEVAQGFRKVAEFDQAWDAAKSNIMYPALNADFWPTVNNYAKQLSAAQGKGFYDPDVQNLATGMAVRDYGQKGNQWLVANGAAPIDLPDFTAMKDAALHVSGNPDLLKAIRTGFDDARAANREVLKEVKKEATEARRMFGDDTRDLAKYEGQHPSLKNPPSPIAFSRFSEHTTDIPGIGKAEGIYVNELQSDLLDDLRKRGPKGGSRQKDEEEFRRVLSDINAVADPRSAEAMGLHGRRRILDQRRASPESQYSLPEAFAGMETSPQVAQQLMVKNAVSGAMQMGKQFVAFPGKESAQAQLYEKLGPNLKSVVKDLGPGFELRDVTLRDPDGRELMHKAIVWGPDAAARIQKKGVPFKDGGAVERQTADHRKYL